MKRNTLFVLPLLCTVFFVYSCNKELSLENSISLTPAEGSLWDTAGNCLPDSVHGTFYTGVQPGADTAYIEIQVDVSVAGNYNISTDLQNGFMFSDSGFFATAGINTVQLKPIGTPVLIQPTVFTVTFDSTICFLTVNVLDSTGLGLGGTDTIPTPGDSTNLSDTAWQFSVGANYYHGQIDTGFIVDTIGIKYLTIIGTNTLSGDTAFSMGIMFLTGNLEPGTYSTASEASIYLTTVIPPSTPVIIYQADITSGVSSPATITISSYDSSTGIVTGTFSGEAVDNLGNTITIVNGSFKAKIT